MAGIEGRDTRVVVIGGGVVGLAAAFSLLQRGCSVTILEARVPGQGASRVNAGWICPSLPEPVPSPGLVKTSAKWMLQSDSPLYIEPRPNPAMLRWLFTFWRSCNAKHFDAATESVVNLNQRTFPCYDAMRTAGVAFEEHRQGLLFAFISEVRFAAILASHEKITKFGVPYPQTLNALQIHRLEPALSDNVIGGFWYEQDRHVRPDTLTSSLVHYLEERGVRIRRGVGVTGLERSGARLTNVVTSEGRMETDLALLAAGCWSPQIAEMVGIRLPIQPGKGYSLDYSPSPQAITHPLDLPDFRMAVSPMTGFTRLAGTMEFSGINETIRPERVAAIRRGAMRTLRDWPSDPELPTVGSGLRPVSADGLPMIGMMPGFTNFATATGHGMLGVTLAAATADTVAEQLTTGMRPDVLEPFDPGRFGRW